MIQTTARIETWRIDQVRKYLKREFPGSTLDDYPRGAHAAHLFLVRKEPGIGKGRPTTHQLLVTRGFFDRFTDQGALHEALVVGDVAEQLRRSGERTVELY